jgi:hypothetical protein
MQNRIGGTWDWAKQKAFSFWSAGNIFFALIILSISFQMPLPGNQKLEYSVIEAVVLSVSAFYILQERSMV